MPLSEAERMDGSYTNSAFWKPIVNTSDLEDILADYEWVAYSNWPSTLVMVAHTLSECCTFVRLSA